jgi:peptide/nickel transport system ATP-binding protein
VGDGCPFAPRCPYVVDECRQDLPKLVTAPNGNLVACIRSEEISAGGLHAISLEDGYERPLDANATPSVAGPDHPRG